MVIFLHLIGVWFLVGACDSLKKNVAGFNLLMWLVIASSIIQICLDLFGAMSISGSIKEVGQVSILIVCLLIWLRNKRQIGFLAIAVGLFGNALATFLNGGMPAFPIDSGFPVGYVLMNEKTKLAFLGDWIPELFPSGYASPGDYMLCTGILLIGVQNSRIK